MNPYEALEEKLRARTSVQDAAEVLSELLSGGYAVWTDGTLYNIRQLVARVYGLQIHVYANDHSPPHFHVIRPDIDASFRIDNGAFLKGSIDGREQRLVQWWYERSRDLLVETWNATRPSDCPVGPIR
jgi:hypothetical protein